MRLVLLLEIGILAGLSLVFLYQAVPVLASFIYTNKQLPRPRGVPNRIAVLILAHNEELLIERCLRTVISVEYPISFRDIYVIADNCTDRTAEKVASYPVTCLERKDLANPGKGYAIQWALQRINCFSYDAVLFLDADAVVSPNIAMEADRLLSCGEKAIQVYNGTLNAQENWLTRCFYVSDVFQFILYFRGREALGLTCRLLGNGMCLHTDVL
ncbi:MAG: glycosyltransferase family 2 protein, partial [Candidatus Binatia bacterium]